MSSTYTAVGTRATMTDPDAGVTSYQYDSANRLTSLTNPINETTGLQYDALGRLVRQDNANGTYGTWTFDAAGQVTNVATKKSNDTMVLSMAYTRDNVGNPTQITDQLLLPDNQILRRAQDRLWEAGTWTFGYDNIDRLTLEKRTGSHPYWYEYALDGAGNRTQFVQKDGNGDVIGTTNATYSADNRLLAYGNTSYTWDNNGNQVAKTTNQVTVTYTWDYENKMTGLRLRAERKGNGDGRVYLITATVTDASGNVTKKCRAVTVPMSQSAKDKDAVAAQVAAAVAAGVPLPYDSTAGPVVGPKQ
ncbi:MAG: hypothetical protein COZ06_25995 [Armatimonadetes bacterium CG_4_10_14_3_um_filter_66_18]|nr:RHS repeat protein [Armatimonadota bacterium]NCP33699.1 RHS repeat protein [Armatimonadota bacterium]PIU91005.1 MAG: hypothetical protein COS65_23415 [Armatimonadetes bacterium CG06_land_8_20_14_3_00_66_21]PIX47954.1 MAG: hypothetical protein COZ57_07060 [Armatimonadetes bacterium CG_4_8_14_3_um_filter_66_20]PIY42044.1 MAG: hypothetical protein COZ06_25995 [Armatimonadetes bacterium CG_4_10_14_3_um_filter_66_18]